MRLKHIPDWSMNFGCSVSKAQKQIENGSVQLPGSGIIIKSASSSKKQQKEVYFFISASRQRSTTQHLLDGTDRSVSNNKSTHLRSQEQYRTHARACTHTHTHRLTARLPVQDRQWADGTAPGVSAKDVCVRHARGVCACV